MHAVLSSAYPSVAAAGRRGQDAGQSTDVEMRDADQGDPNREFCRSSSVLLRYGMPESAECFSRLLHACLVLILSKIMKPSLANPLATEVQAALELALLLPES